MATVPHSSGAARGLFLAPLLVCLVLAVGVLALAPLCGDGMSLALPAASADSHKYAAATADGAQPTTAEPRSESDALLMACVVILVAVLVAVLGLRRPWLSRATTPPPSPAGAKVVPGLRRPPLLAELCVLRT